MNLELQTLTWAQAASLHTDALIVLVSQKQAKTTGLLATMLAQAEKSGDFAPTAGQCMLWWKPPGLNTQRLLFAGTGSGRAQDVRQAVTSAIQAVKKSKASKVTICLQDSHEPHLVVAAQAAADAAYVYTATKPSAKASLITRICLGVPDAKRSSASFAMAKAQVAGVALAREWGNRPANHATPELLAKAAKALAKHPKLSCEGWGSKKYCG